MPTIARKLINRSIEEYSKQVKGKVLFVGVNHQWQDHYAKLFDEFVTMDIRKNVVKPDIYGDIQNCPEIPKESFDGVIMTGVWELLKRPSEAMYEINRILKLDNLASTFYPMRVEEVRVIYYKSNDPFYFAVIARKC